MSNIDNQGGNNQNENLNKPEEQTPSSNGIYVEQPNSTEPIPEETTAEEIQEAKTEVDEAYESGDATTEDKKAQEEALEWEQRKQSLIDRDKQILSELREMGPDEYTRRSTELAYQLIELLLQNKNALLEKMEEKYDNCLPSGGYRGDLKQAEWMRQEIEKVKQNFKPLESEEIKISDTKISPIEYVGDRKLFPEYPLSIWVDGQSTKPPTPSYIYSSDGKKIAYKIEIYNWLWSTTKNQLTPEQKRLLELINAKIDFGGYICSYLDCREKLIERGFDLDNPNIFNTDEQSSEA